MRKYNLFLSLLMVMLLSVGNVWAEVESGTTYTTDPKTPSVPANWTVNSYDNTATYTKLASNTNYIQTEEFCQNGFTSIKIKARKFGGPSAAQGVISVEWFETGGSSTVLATTTPGGTSLTDITLSDLASVTGNKSGYIKISCKEASGGKGCGVSQVTITYTAGTCGGGTPTCATPTFSPAAGSYEGTQNVTISSTSGATIYYTTDGSTPTTSSSVYSAAIPVAADMTIKAYAVKDGSNDSEVATAAYTITEGPDVTINLLDEGWGFPTSKVVDETSYTNGNYTIKVAGTTGNGFRTYGTYFLLGQSGAYIELPAFANPIEKIVVTGNSNGSASVAWNIFKGDNAVSTAASGCKNDAYTFNIDPVESNVVYRLKVTNAANLQIKAIKIYYGEAPAVAKPTISGDVNFVSSTTVTISHDDADHIYYTINGSTPTTSSTEYSAPFPLTNTTTVKAIAVKGSVSSDVVSKTFTKVEALESMEALLNATTSTETAFNVVISNWVVTGVNGSRAWIADAANEKGILLYKSGHGFTAGKKLNGTVIGTKAKLYQGYPELTTLVSTDVTVTTAEAITPRTTTIAALTSGHPAEQGTVVKLENVTYSSSVLSDGVNSIAADNKLFSSLALVDGTTYDITGVVEYLDGGVVKIMPRSADDVEAKSAVVVPTAANLAALKAAERGTYILTLTNAVVTYVNGNNAFIEDATGGALIYFASHGYSAGDCLNGDYQVTTTDYQGKFEITAMEPQAGAATTTAEIPLTTVSIATLNADFAAYESKRIKIAGANVTDAISGSDRNGAINDGAALAVYAAVASTITLTADDNVDIIGYPGFHNTDQQLNVWKQEDITVNVKDPAGIAFDPESATITAGDAWSAPEFANPNSLDVEFSSDDESVAKVSSAGVVSLEGGYGTAVITAHTDGDATHSAGNATYTITVNDPGATPVYTMSFDMTRASYDAAADAQVVWNSSVVTITADKNDGTKVTNYLAGNYSGTTLIAETRLYAKNSISFVPKTGVTITKIEWMSTAKGYATKLAAETFVNATAVVDGTDDKLVIITPSATGEISVTLKDAARATGVTVYYEAESEKSKLDASIVIANINMAVGDDDILLSAIAATSNPNKKAISYAVTSGTAVTIEGTGAEAALHAAAEGSATITATIPNDLGNYTGATTSFTVTVSAAATLESIAISGTATELEYTEGQSFNPAGLTVMGHYSNGSDEEITEGIDWTFDPDPLTEGTTSVSVTATVETISSDAIVVNGLTVSGPAPVGDNYVKVTVSQADWSGDYLLVYEDGTDAYVWNGDYNDGASNYASATISSNTIAKPDAAAVITIAAASEGKYTLQVNGDKYFQDNGSNSKLIFTDAIADAAEVTISYETDWTKLQFSERCIRFNNNSGQTRFRFYAASSQQAVQLYKKEATPSYIDIRTGLTAGNYYTICYPKAMTAIQGGILYSLGGLETNSVYLVQEDAPFVAGRPYILYATADKLEAVVEGDIATAGYNNGLYGTLSDMNAEALTAAGATHMLYNNSIRAIGTNNSLAAGRAYIILDNIPGGAPSGQAPGRVRSIPMQENVATDIEATGLTDKPVKVMIDGQLFILRGESLYDMTGRLAK